jgi:hypothetical protein
MYLAGAQHHSHPIQSHLQSLIQREPSFDWLTMTNQKAAQTDPKRVFDELFSDMVGVDHLIRKVTSRSKYTIYSFNWVLTSDGVFCRTHVISREIGSSDPSVNIDTITAVDLDRWIAQHKTLIAVDPGDKDIISAVRFHPSAFSSSSSSSSSAPVHSSINRTYDRSTRKGRSKHAKQLREA